MLLLCLKTTEQCYILNWVGAMFFNMIMKFPSSLLIFFKVCEDVLWPQVFLKNLFRNKLQPPTIVTVIIKNTSLKKKSVTICWNTDFSLQCGTHNKTYMSNFASDADAWSKITLTASIKWIYSPYTNFWDIGHIVNSL